MVAIDLENMFYDVDRGALIDAASLRHWHGTRLQHTKTTVYMYTSRAPKDVHPNTVWRPNVNGPNRNSLGAWALYAQFAEQLRG